MAYFYVGGDRDQAFLMPVSMRDWLEEGHLAWFVIDVVARVDTSGFHALHPNDGPGRPAYDPDMMLALLFYAYGTGVRSSRRIEAACRSDAAYRVICGGVTPDHATIARFLVDHEAAIEVTFVSVLRLCAAAGLASLGTIAIDGTKMGADAALDANRGVEWIRAEVQRIVSDALATDADEDQADALFGPDELPAELSPHKGRLARLEAALAEIEAQDAKARIEAAGRAEKARAAAREGACSAAASPRILTPRWPGPRPSTPPRWPGPRPRRKSGRPEDAPRRQWAASSAVVRLAPTKASFEPLVPSMRREPQPTRPPRLSPRRT